MTKSFLTAATAITLTLLSLAPASAQENPSNPGVPATSTYSCDSQLGTLPRVYQADIAGIDDHHRVWVTELCSSFEGLSSEGNGAYLRPAIAKNGVIRDVLRSKSYSADDVFAVRMMGEDTIHLYVHHFN